MRRPVIALALAGLLIGASASVALATTTKTEVVGTVTNGPVVYPGTMTMHADVESMRGFVQSYSAVWSSPYVTGTEINVINFDLNTATGRGALWGTGHHVTAYPGGTWDCTFAGPFVDFVWYGKGVCHGGGTLAGWQWRADLMSTATGLTGEGYIFLPAY